MFEIVSIVGLGYIGLPTAAMFAKSKIKVIGVDINRHAVDTINKGETHIVEPDLDVIVRAAVRQGYLRATSKPEPADAFLIAVPTPFIGDYEPDLSFVKAAAKSIAPVLKKGDLVILESTSPVGTTEQVAGWLAEERSDLKFPHQHGDHADIYVAYCPERVLPGKVVEELVSNDRIIGGLTVRCSERAIELYKTFVKAECIVTNVRVAEMCKLTENAFRDVNIAFANELSIICDELGVDVWQLISLANRHPRVKVLSPGPGVGGHCIAVDPWFIVHKSPSTARLIKSAREINDEKPDWVLKKIEVKISEFLKNNAGRTRDSLVVGCFGIAFKPDIDDLRESPALAIVSRLLQAKLGKVLVVEPNIEMLPEGLEAAELTHISAAIPRCDLAIFLVKHSSFIPLSDTALASIPIVIDACGVLARQ